MVSAWFAMPTEELPLNLAGKQTVSHVKHGERSKSTTDFMARLDPNMDYTRMEELEYPSRFSIKRGCAMYLRICVSL